MSTIAPLQKKPRAFLPEDLTIESWESIAPFFEDLQSRALNNSGELEHWLRDRSELESVVSETAGWRYIKMTCDTTDKTAEQAFLQFVSEIEPKIAPYQHELNQKLVDSPFVDTLDADKYFIYLRSVKKAIEIYREENIPLFVEIQTKQQKYGAITGAMTIEHNGQELTLQQAANLLKETDRNVREAVFKTISARRLQDQESLDELFDELIQLRHQVALNAGFTNFRDYMFAALGRFDYTPEDCFSFHEAIATQVVPLIKELHSKRKEALELDKLRPWDLEVDIKGAKAPVPFKDGKDLLNKSVACFDELHPFFAQCLRTMDEMKHLDLESRKGKAPGGYNYPLAESGVPFIFMNAASSTRDVETMVHEGGHAIHSILTRDLELNAFKDLPSEVAELASMSMELISIDGWQHFYNPEELKQAKVEQLEGIIKVLPWIATIDQFQHWLYTNPEHSRDERKQAWLEIGERFGTGMIDWTGHEAAQAYTWQKQLHLYEVPFYYIEYGIAQLGAIAMWQNYLANKGQGIENYMNALKLGYTRTIGDIYQAGQVDFDFSSGYVKKLMTFLQEQLQIAEES